MKHSTQEPIVLSEDLVARVAKNHSAIVATAVKAQDREETGNARFAVTKPSTIPPWAK